MLNVVVVFVVGFGGGDDDDVGRQLFFFDVHLSVTCECKSCSKGGACFCVFFFFSFLSVASSALFVKAWEARKKRRVWVATSYVESKDSKTPFLGW